MRLPALALLASLPLLACGEKDGDDSGADRDGDGDGFTVSEDCDDNAATVNPDAPELCDGRDNNCDGLIDVGATDAPTWYIDYDGDGFGGDAFTLTQCEQPAGYLPEAQDCDDTQPQIHPEASEGCLDGVDDDCDAAVDCDDDGCGGDDACLPLLTEVNPRYGYADSTTSVTLTGYGFGWATAGSPSVTVGGQAASNVVVVDNTTLTADLPPGTAGLADIEVSTGNGSALLSQGWLWTVGLLYAADGKQGEAGSLYAIDPPTGSLFEIGALDVGFTGMAFGPDGTLYGTESSRGGGGEDGVGSLYTIDPTTAALTLVGPLTDSDGAHHNTVADITFVGSRLIGWSEYGDVPVEIDPSTGAVEVVGAFLSSAGDGFAYDSSAGLIWFLNYSGVYWVDPSTGSASFASFYSGLSHQRANAAAFHLGTLHLVDSINQSDTALLATIDPFTGVITSLLELPGGVDAIASATP